DASAGSAGAMGLVTVRGPETIPSFSLAQRMIRSLSSLERAAAYRPAIARLPNHQASSSFRVSPEARKGQSITLDALCCLWHDQTWLGRLKAPTNSLAGSRPSTTTNRSALAESLSCWPNTVRHCCSRIRLASRRPDTGTCANSEFNTKDGCTVCCTRL